MKKKILFTACMLIIACVSTVAILGTVHSTAQAHQNGYNHIACNIERRGGYTIYDIRQILGQDTVPEYQYLRVFSQNGGVETLREPIDQEEFGRALVQSFSTTDFPDAVELIHSGKCDTESIVVVLMGDGFTYDQQGEWCEYEPDPEPGTFLARARDGMNAMLETRPFSYFIDLFTFLAVPIISEEEGVSNAVGTTFTPDHNVDTFFQSYMINASNIRMTTEGRARANQVMNHVTSSPTMLQVLVNTQMFGGVAYWGWDYWLHVGVAVTTVQERSSGPWNQVWFAILIHEFGHTFGFLGDSHPTGTQSVQSANVCRDTTEETVKWSHWIGLEGMGLNSSPIGTNIGRVVPCTSAGLGGCLMHHWWNARNFSAVSSAELTRRLANLSGETFRNGRSPDSSRENPTPLPLATMTAVSEFNRILPYAFNGNRILHTLTIPEGFDTIGRYAFLGAIGLRVIHNQNAIPQQINATTFAGLGVYEINRSQIRVHIPAGTYAAYRAAGWHTFNLVESPFVFTVINAALRTASVSVNRGVHAQIPSELHIPEQVWINGHYHTVTQIEANGFSGVHGVMIVHTPSTVTTIGNNAFSITTTVNWQNNFRFRGNDFLRYLGTAASFSIPSSVGGRVINRISFEAFADNLHIRNLTIPNTITTIEDRAFANATNLRGIINLTSNPQIINNTTFQGVNTSRIMLGVSQNMTQPFINVGWRNFMIIEQHLFRIIVMPNGDIEFFLLFEAIKAVQCVIFEP